MRRVRTCWIADSLFFVGWNQRRANQVLLAVLKLEIIQLLLHHCNSNSW